MPADLLSGGGAPVFKYKEPGVSLDGTIVAYEERDQTTPGGELKTFDDGRVMRMAVLTIEQADGNRVRDFVRGHKLHALRTAYAELGADDPVGLRYRCERIADKPPTVKGHAPTHQFEVSLKRSSELLEGDDGADLA